MFAPPYSSGTVMPSTPSSPILRHRSIGKLVVAVDLGRARGDLGLGEVMHRVAQRVDVFTELEIQAGQAHGGAPRARGEAAAQLTYTSIRYEDGTQRQVTGSP